MSKIIEPGSIDWVMWVDWLNQYAGRFRDWTIVAQYDGFSHIGEKAFTWSFSTFSILVRNDEQIIKTFFNSNRYAFDFNQRVVDIDSSGSKPEVEIRCFNKDTMLLISKIPKIYDYQSTWRMEHLFEDYFDLRYNDAGQLLDPRSGEIIVKIPNPVDSGPVEIRTDYLQDFLAGINMILIRRHDHRRHWNTPIAELPVDGGTDEDVIEKWGQYYINFHNSGSMGVPPFSRILCKDFILPANSAGSVGLYKDRIKDNTVYPEFIVDRKIDGTLIKEVPNRDKLHPFVYFSPKVLKKYYDEPSKYSVGWGAPGYGSVGDDEGWSLSIGLTSEGLVFCWLGDIAKCFMPPAEVTHWHSYNIPPRGDDSESFIRSQLHGRFSKQAGLDSRLRFGRDQLKKIFTVKNESIFKNFKGPHRHLEKQIRVPLYNEFPEFKDCIINLATFFIEYIDSKLLKQSLPKELTVDKDGNGLSSISLFENFMSKNIDLDDSTRNAFISSLRILQDVRSKSGAAHQFSDQSFSKVLTRLELGGNPTAVELYLAIAEPLALAIENVCVQLEKTELLWWLTVKE